jgi:acyl carrier protein
LLRQFNFKDLEESDLTADYEKDLKWDSLEWTAVLTSIEHEFHTVFEDRLYEHFRTINDFINLLEKDHMAF